MRQRVGEDAVEIELQPGRVQSCQSAHAFGIVHEFAMRPRIAQKVRHLLGTLSNEAFRVYCKPAAGATCPLRQACELMFEGNQRFGYLSDGLTCMEAASVRAPISL